MRATAAALLAVAARAAPPSATTVVRFEDEEGVVRHGAGAPQADGTVELIDGDVFGERLLTGARARVAKLLPPVPKPPAVYAIGLNYAAHACHEDPKNCKLPVNPIVFFKNRNCYNGPGPVEIPAFSEEPDYEGELVLVIKQDCKDVKRADYAKCVLGYASGNDVSARCYQVQQNQTDSHGVRHVCQGNGGQWSFSKGLDGHGPFGPQLVMQEALGDASGMLLQTKVNGVLRQNASTTDMIFGVPEIIEFITQGTTVEQGTVVFTGTCGGVGMNLSPPTYLDDGDVVTVSITDTAGGRPDLGTLTNNIVRKSAP